MSFFEEPSVDKLNRRIEARLKGFDAAKYTSHYIGGTESQEVDDHLHSIALDMEKDVDAKVLNAAWAWWYMNCVYTADDSAIKALECLEGVTEAINKAKGGRKPPAYSEELTTMIKAKAKKGVSAKEIYRSLVGEYHGVISSIEDTGEGLRISYGARDGAEKEETIKMKTIQNRLAKIKKSR